MLVVRPKIVRMELERGRKSHRVRGGFRRRRCGMRPQDESRITDKANPSQRHARHCHVDDGLNKWVVRSLN